jgi:hypothetical protein
MKKHIQLNIPRSCHESWDQMTPVDKARPDDQVGRGRFCGLCQKQVVDFTNMSDEQLALFFRKPSNGSVCGRFMQDQLDRTIDIPKKRIPWVKYFFQFLLPGFLMSCGARTVGKIKVNESKNEVITKSTYYQTTGIVMMEFETIILPDTIKKENIVNNEVTDKVELLIDDTNILTTIPIQGEVSERIAYELSGPINSKENFIDDTSSYPPEITEKLVFTGGVVVEKEVNIFDTIFNKVFSTKKSLKLYPNPIKRGSSLTIETNKHEKGNHLFQLSAANGQIVLTKELWIDENSRVVKINIPPVAAGTYFLQMINKQSGKGNTEKIIIE